MCDITLESCAGLGADKLIEQLLFLISQLYMKTNDLLSTSVIFGH